MTHARLPYELSVDADNDLSDIYDYTTEHFGASQAVQYLIRLEQVFDSLCSNPKTGRERNDIRKGLRSISHESHTIFYRIMKDCLRIVRVLHASRDIIRFLPPSG